MKAENRDNKTRQMRQLWRVTLRLHSGGIMMLPFPAYGKEHAERLAQSAGRCFGGDVIMIEYLWEDVTDGAQ